MGLQRATQLRCWTRTTAYIGLPRWLSCKEAACQCPRHKRHGFDPWVRKTPWIRKWQPTPVFLPGQSHGWRSLVGSMVSQRVEHDWTTEHTLTLPTYPWVSEWVKLLSHVRLFATPWTVAPQAPLSMGFSRQEYWSGLPFPSPGDLTYP